MIGMALLAVLMSVNFASCSNEDDTPTEEGSSTNQPIVEKKLVRVMKNEPDGASMTIDFKYDKKGNVVKVERWRKRPNWEDTDTVEYIWDSYKSITWDLFTKYECTLNKDAKITSISSSGGYDRAEKNYCEYNGNGNIIEHGSLEDGTIHGIYAWDNHQLEKITAGRDVTTFSYENQTCKGFFPLLIEFLEIGSNHYQTGRFFDGYFIFMAQPELLGIRTSSLPSEINYSNYTILFDNYNFDSDGYVTRCTVSQQWDSGANYGNDIYRFIWE